MSNQIMNCLCVLSTYNRLGRFSISAIQPESLSSYCLMKRTPSKGFTIFFPSPENWDQGNDMKLSLMRKLRLRRLGLHVTVRSVMKHAATRLSHLMPEGTKLNSKL